MVFGTQVCSSLILAVVLVHGYVAAYACMARPSLKKEPKSQLMMTYHTLRVPCCSQKNKTTTRGLVITIAHQQDYPAMRAVIVLCQASVSL